MSDTTKNIFNRDIPQEKQTIAQVEIFDKYADEIFSKEDIEVKTELNDRQIVAFSRGMIFAKKYNMNLLEGLINQISIYSISKGRKGRKEFENVAKANLGMHNEESTRNIPGRLFGTK